MPLQIKRIPASDFTPASGSRISLDVDHLKCDDYLVGVDAPGNPQRITSNPVTGRIWMRPSGGTPAAVYYAPFDLSSWTTVVLSDGFTQWCSGLAVDDDDSFYKIGTTERKVRKYNSAGTWQWTSAFAANHGMMFYLPTNHIYICDYNNHRVREVDKAGNVITDRLLTDDLAQGTNPSDVFIDSTGIYILCARSTDARIMKYDLSWNYQSNIQVGWTDTLTYQLCRYGAGLARLSSGDFIMGSFGQSQVLFVNLIQVDSTGILKKVLVDYGTAPEKGQVQSTGSFSSNATCFGATEDDLYMAMVGNSKVAKIDTRDASERIATYQYDFGSSLNIERLNLNGLFDNRDTSWKNVRLWYQIDGGGYVEVDLKNPLLDINGQVLDLKVGMTSYGFLRNWPEVYSVDIVYDDGQKDIGERSFETIDMSKETEVIDLSSELEVIEL